MRKITFLTLFIRLKKYFFNSNTILEKTTEKIHLILLFFNKDNFFFKLKKIFLWVILRMYYATVQTFISLIHRKKTIKFFFKKETFLWPYTEKILHYWLLLSTRLSCVVARINRFSAVTIRVSHTYAATVKSSSPSNREFVMNDLGHYLFQKTDCAIRGKVGRRIIVSCFGQRNMIYKFFINI